MNIQSIERWTHDHVFGQDRPRAGESRTRLVIAITAVMMALEIGAGIAYGSMALLADGLHMASHASALAISALAYYYTRRHAHDARFNFGTGKINSLAAFASATLLAAFSLIMTWQSAARLLAPVKIEFNQAILVAVLGLAVNGVCLLILKSRGHSHDDEHEHAHEDHGHAEESDHNLWSAYLHVLADALTSVLAIGALLAGKRFGMTWMDPAMGVLGAALVIRWAWQLLRASSHVLLDMQAPETMRRAICEAIERRGDARVTDLHAWSVGPGIYAAEIGVVASEPASANEYRKLLPEALGVVHVTIEAQRCESRAAA
jgi:cation diffusion facilitator family transporter